MPLMTVKEMVEDILNDMDSDPLFTVTGGEDITATEESRQVVQILKTTYFNIIDGRPGGWKHLYNTFQMTPVGASAPTTLTIPTNVMNFDYIKYNVRTVTDTKDKFKEIKYLEPKEFLDLTDSRDSSATEITQVTATSGIFINVYNDRAPSFWTSPDDTEVIFDSYDTAVDATSVVAVKTQCYGQIYPTFTETDAFVPDLPTDAFSYFLAEAKSMCFLNIKQAGNPKVEAQAVTQRRRMSQEAHKIQNGIRYANFGRRRIK